jgi:hypothetical protein
MYIVKKLSCAKCGILPSEPYRTELIFSTWKHLFQSALPTFAWPTFLNVFKCLIRSNVVTVGNAGQV